MIMPNDFVCCTLTFQEYRHYGSVTISYWRWLFLFHSHHLVQFVDFS